MTVLDVEIDRHVKAMRRHRAALDQLAAQARGACCPSCFWGATYNDLSDRYERCGAWLRKLLLKRGAPDDLDLAGAIAISAWP